MEALHIDWDGTTQLAFGYPHFKEASHCEDGAAQRIGSHLNIVIVAGEEIVVYDNLDYIYQGPDLTIELLQRTLKRYEKVVIFHHHLRSHSLFLFSLQLNGFLPDILYLQADNCYRENKNHALLCYLGNLLERGVFKEIHISYFCVGHTHFGPDQVASRISCGCRLHTIENRLENADVIANCYTPRLLIRHLDTVANSQDVYFPVKTGKPGKKQSRSYAKCNRSVIKRLNLISTVRHFRLKMGVDVARDSNDDAPETRVVYQTKQKADAEWSLEVPLFWNNPSGIADRQYGNSIQKSPKEMAPIVAQSTKGLEKCKARLLGKESYKRCLRDIEMLANPPSIPFHWDDGGIFDKEKHQTSSSDSDEV